MNLYFPYAGQGLLLFRWWQQRFEFQLVHVAEEGKSSMCKIHMCSLKSHFRRDFLAYYTRPVSVHLAVACVGCSFNNFSVFLLCFTQPQNLMKLMFSCIHFPVWPYPPKIMIFFIFYTGKLYGLTGMHIYGPTSFQSDHPMVLRWPAECTVIWVWFQPAVECIWSQVAYLILNEHTVMPLL